MRKHDMKSPSISLPQLKPEHCHKRNSTISTFKTAHNAPASNFGFGLSSGSQTVKNEASAFQFASPTSECQHSSPLRPHVRSINEMMTVDNRRYQTFLKFKDQHEVTDTDGDREATLEEKAKARTEGLSKRAKEIQKWTDDQKIEIFKKYETMNIKTYKCRNKQNISTLVNQMFDPKQSVVNASELYEPRLKAFNAVSRHFNDIDQVSTHWLHEKSVKAFEGMSGSGDDPHLKQQVELEVKALLQNSQSVNQVDTKMARNTNNNSQMDTSQRHPSDQQIVGSEMNCYENPHQSSSRYIDNSLNYAILQSENAISLGHLQNSGAGQKLKNYGLTKKKEVLKPSVSLKKSLVNNRAHILKLKSDN